MSDEYYDDAIALSDAQVENVRLRAEVERLSAQVSEARGLLVRFIDNADVAQYSATIDESYHEISAWLAANPAEGQGEKGDTP